VSFPPVPHRWFSATTALFVLNGQLHLSISESYSLWILGLLHGYVALRALAPRHSFWPSTSQPRGINCDTRSGQTVYIKRPNGPNGKVWNGQTWRWLVPVDQGGGTTTTHPASISQVGCTAVVKIFSVPWRSCWFSSWNPHFWCGKAVTPPPSPSPIELWDMVHHPQ
jgi:hypothetical protein